MQYNVFKYIYILCSSKIKLLAGAKSTLPQLGTNLLAYSQINFFNNLIAKKYSVF
jgi:hypothetical protein